MGNNYNVDALTVIINALKDLDQESQVRTLSAVSTFFGLSLTSNEAKNTLVESEDKNSKKTGVAFSDDRQISPKDFLRDKMPATDIERVTCLAYYLTHYRGINHFKTLDLTSLNIEAAQPKFSNAAQSVDNATKAGYLVQAVKGSKQLSVIGETFVQKLPDREAAREAASAIRSRKRTKKAPKKAPKK
ncbi:MAG: hypothetical protein ACTHMV_15975 [Chitinophagaceae bacterium]